MPPYIEEPSIKSPREPSSKFKVNLSNPKKPSRKNHHPRTADPLGLVSGPKSGF
jgi:hypothetical protein